MAAATIHAATLSLALTAATTAAGQSSGPVTATAAALGLPHGQALALEREWDRLDAWSRYRIRCAGTRGQCRTWIEALRVLHLRIPEGVRAGGAPAVARFLHGKHWSHIVPRSTGGGDGAANGRWEDAEANRRRGAATMDPKRVRELDRQAARAGATARIGRHARRLARGGAAGAAAGAAVGVAVEGYRLRTGEITADEFRARSVGAATRTAIAGGAAGAAAAVAAIVFPPLAPISAPTAGLIVGALAARAGDAAAAAATAATRTPIVPRARHEGAAALSAYVPQVSKTATSRTLYAPPFADPEEIRAFIRRQLKTR